MRPLWLSRYRSSANRHPYAPPNGRTMLDLFYLFGTVAVFALMLDI